MTPKMGFDIMGPLAQRKQAASAEELRAKQGEMFDTQKDLAAQSAESVRLENVLAAERARWAMTPEGKAAIHGKMIGGVWGPPAAAALAVAEDSLKGPPRAPDWLKIYGPGQKPKYDTAPKEK